MAVRLLTIHLKCYPYSYDYGSVSCTYPEDNSEGWTTETATYRQSRTFTIFEGDTIMLNGTPSSSMYAFKEWNIRPTGTSPSNVRSNVPDEGTSSSLTIPNFTGSKYDGGSGTVTEFDIIGRFYDTTVSCELTVSTRYFKESTGSTLFTPGRAWEYNYQSKFGSSETAKITCDVESYFSDMYTFWRWDMSAGSSEVTEYVYTKDTLVEMTTSKQAIAVFLPYANDGHWNVEKDESTISDGITVNVTQYIYKQGCHCSWKLRIASDTNKNGYVDYVNPYWSLPQYSQPQLDDTGRARITLPLSYNGQEGEDFSAYLRKYSKTDTINARLMLTITDFDSITTSSISVGGLKPDFYLLRSDDYRNVIIKPGDYTPVVSQNGVVYTNTFNNKVVSGWSQITSSCDLSNSPAGGSELGRNMFPVTSTKITYTNSYRGYYSGSEFIWNDETMTGNVLVGCIDNNPILRSDSNYQMKISVTATNSVNKSTSLNYEFANGSETKDYVQIWGWYQPKYTLKEILRCDEYGVVQYNNDLNTCISIEFEMLCPSLMTDEERAAGGTGNILETLYTVIDDYSVAPTYSESSKTYKSIFSNREYDRIKNYEIAIVCQDTITRTFSPTTFYTYNQQSGTPIPMSLFQDNYMRVGVGFGTMANTPECINIGLDTKFAPDSNLKSINDDGVVSVPAYTLLARGGENSVAISDNDLLGSYVNNVKVLSLVEYQKIIEPDEHTLYIII